MPHEWIPGLAQPFGLLLYGGTLLRRRPPGLNLAKFESGVLLQWSESCLGVQSQLCENLADTLESSLFGCMPKQAESFPTSTRCSFPSDTHVLGYGLKRSAVLCMPQTWGNFACALARGVVTSKESSLLT